MSSVPDPPSIHQGSFEQLRPFLLEPLQPLNPTDQEIALTLIRGELDQVEAPTTEASHRGINRSLTEHDIHYVYQSDDIKLLKEASLVTVGLVGLLMLSKGPVGLIGALVVLLWRYRRRRIELTGDEAIVLLTLKRAPDEGWRAEELSQNLPLKTEMDTDQVTSILERLHEVKRKDGTRTKLVDHDDLRWWAVDV